MKKSNKRVIVALVAFITVLSGAYMAYRTIRPSVHETWLTIFVHGSVTPLLRPPKPSLMVKLLRDNLEGTLYLQATKKIRNNPYFTKDQAMQEMGLKKINTSNSPSSFLAQAFDRLDTWIHTEHARNNLFYTYGWSGIVGQKIRYHDSVQFYKELSEEVASLRAQGINPKIRIVGYCHGGGIALNLADVLVKENLPQTFCIDELILLAVPIYKTMRPQLYSPLFKKIYNLYSRNDGVQRFDLLAPGSIFSGRLFSARRKKKLPDKLKQIEIKITVDRPGSSTLQDMSPYHLENWFFGWTSRGYRKDFPFYPLPTVAIMPAIVKAAEAHGQARCTIDIRPDQNKIIVNNKNKSQACVDLLPEGKSFSEIRSLIPKSAILPRTPQEYNDKVNTEIKHAKQEMASEKRARRQVKIA